MKMKDVAIATNQPLLSSQQVKMYAQINKMEKEVLCDLSGLALFHHFQRFYSCYGDHHIHLVGGVKEAHSSIGVIAFMEKVDSDNVEFDSTKQLYRFYDQESGKLNQEIHASSLQGYFDYGYVSLANGGKVLMLTEAAKVTLSIYATLEVAS